MKRLGLIGCCIFFSGCTGSISKEDLKVLNGYWEIEQVTFPNGDTKKYKVNTSVDYIQLEGMKGFRKKVRPKLNGTYETSDDAEVFMISEANENFLINYKTELSEWSEKLVSLDSDTFSVVNEEGFLYKYSRFEPISLME